MAQVCDQFSPFIFRINGLCVHTTQSTSGQDDVGEQWPDLIRAFGGANDFRVAGVYTTDILCTLRPTDGGNTSDTTVLPSLRNLRVEGPMAMHGPLWDAVQSFITSQRLSGRHVQVYAREYTCHICDRSFTEQQELKKHLVDEHLHRILCSYCGNFECMPGYNNLFQRHLESKHPEVAHADTLNSNPALQSSSFSSSYSGSPGTQYNDPRASLTDIFGPLTMLRSAQISTFEDIPTFSDDTIDHFPPSPTWSFESGSEDT
ncbi:hypothetical protein BJY52DRAFT_1303745 [Lactarius psammicola]|nr:hypothetical protein BJY52DRAFT_1303745 [Lactarius psammicola]